LAATDSAGVAEVAVVATEASLVTAAGAAADVAGEGSGLARVPVQEWPASRQTAARTVEDRASGRMSRRMLT